MQARPERHLAHTENATGQVDFLSDHLSGVAHLASTHAEPFGAAEEARWAGLLHDLGKYGRLFQLRLERPKEYRGIDHWSAGAWASVKRAGPLGIASALAIQGHHIGLQCASRDSLEALEPKGLSDYHPLGLRLSGESAAWEQFLAYLEDDGLQLPRLTRSVMDYRDAYSQPSAGMLDVRMLFSALVDADFLATEAHFEGKARDSGVELMPEQALEALLAHVDEVRSESTANKAVNQLRDDLLQQGLETARRGPGLFTLTAPTGAGKTIALLAFALRHAAEHGLRRVVTVIPYLTIIEQTADVYRSILSRCLSPAQLNRYVLEHHTLAGIREENVGEPLEDSVGSRERTRRLLSENWDAPVVVTTSVQMLESLHANRPAACRKLHRLAKSVILFDEVQTLPTKLAVPTLASLSRLAERYSATIVFSTATQPAFSFLDPVVSSYSRAGWRTGEIVAPGLQLFQRTKRVRVEWPQRGTKTTWDELAIRIVRLDQALVIVNLKRHAKELGEAVAKARSGDVLFLSTNLCPAHRKMVLADVRRRLACSTSCLLISTQCVEAGVDLDFPAVFRAFGPLDAIAQAAGRCNRNGNMTTGTLHVFEPQVDGRLYPDGAYQQAAAVTASLLNASPNHELDLDEAETFKEYYRELYEMGRPEDLHEELTEAIRNLDFAETAAEYRLIDQNTINVLVPYDPESFSTLAEEARSRGLSRSWIQRARPYTISVFRHAASQLPLEPVPLRGGGESGDWFLDPESHHYDKRTGYDPGGSEAFLIA